MAAISLVLHIVITIVIIITNVLHIIPIMSQKGYLNAVKVARILPSVFLLLMTVSFIPVEILHKHNFLVYRLALSDTFEVFQIGTYLGFVLLSAITKLRTYRCNGPSGAYITHKSVLLPAALIVAIVIINSIIVSFAEGTYKLNTTHSNGLSGTVFTIYLVLFSAICVLPSVAIYVVMLAKAFSYYKTISENMKYKSGFVSHVKQYRSVKTFCFTFVSIYLSSWCFYALFAILSECFVDRFTESVLKTIKSFSKLVMYALFPISDGLLREKNLKAIKIMFKNSIQCTFCKLTRSKTTEKQTVKTDIEKTPTFPNDIKSQQINSTTKQTVTTDKIEVLDSRFLGSIQDLREGETSPLSLCVRRLKKNLPVLQLHRDKSPFSTFNMSPFSMISTPPSAGSLYHSISSADIYSISSMLGVNTSQSQNNSPDKESTRFSNIAFKSPLFTSAKSPTFFPYSTRYFVDRSLKNNSIRKSSIEILDV